MGKDEDRYLDSSALLRQLETAERAHQLDAKGVIEELTKAAKHCEARGDYHQSQANVYMLAKCAYYAEIRRRVGLTFHEAGARANATRRGHPDVLPLEKIGFGNWCRSVGVNHSYTRILADIGTANNPEAALRQYHARVLAKQNQSNARSRQSTIAAALTTGVPVPKSGNSRRDPLDKIKIEWGKLSPVQRQAFLEWVAQGMSAKADTRATKPSHLEARV